MARSPLSVARFLKAFIASWLALICLQAGLLYRLGFHWQLALLDSFISNIFTGAVCLLVCFIMQFYLPQKDRYWYILIMSTVMGLLAIYLSRWLLLTTFRPNDLVYSLSWKQSFPLRFGFAFLLIVCISMISMLWYSFQDHQEAARRKTDAEALSKEAELLALRSQLQPHFLFNSLNSISALVGSRPEEARKMIQQLSDFLRGTIKKEDNQVTTLQEELQHLELYLEIEKLRFGHRLTTIIDADENALKLKLPALMLQPIVENAIKFGLYDTVELVTITIEAKALQNELMLTVQNPYDPETARPQKGVGFGLGSVQRRLYLLFARQDLLTTSKKDDLFITNIKIPQSI